MSFRYRRSRAGRSASISRRRFLGRAAVCSAAACSPRFRSILTAHAQEPPPTAPRIEVVEVMSANLTDGQRIHHILLDEMLDAVIRQTGHTATSGEAWRSWFTDDDTILVKFNRSGQTAIGTSFALGRSLMGSMLRADLSPGRIMLLEAPPRLEREFGTRPVPDGWADPVRNFGSGQDQFRAVLEEATAIVNIPFLKSHNIAGMTGCLKNLSHGLIKHPARYHANACSPFIGDIVACPAIRPKLRLNLIDAIRVMFDGGPRASDSHIAPANLLIASTDPVACDSVGLIWLDRMRVGRELSPIGGNRADVPHLAAAEARGLGTSDLDNIRRNFISP